MCESLEYLSIDKLRKFRRAGKKSSFSFFTPPILLYPPTQKFHTQHFPKETLILKNLLSFFCQTFSYQVQALMKTPQPPRLTFAPVFTMFQICAFLYFFSYFQVFFYIEKAGWDIRFHAKKRINIIGNFIFPFPSPSYINTPFFLKAFPFY